MQCGVAYVEAVFLLVLITEYRAPGEVTQYDETKITVLSQACFSPLARKP